MRSFWRRTRVIQVDWRSSSTPHECQTYWVTPGYLGHRETPSADHTGRVGQEPYGEAEAQLPSSRRDREGQRRPMAIASGMLDKATLTAGRQPARGPLQTVIF